MSASHPGSTNVAVGDADITLLDRLVGNALASGHRPGGRRPSRGTVVADLIRRAVEQPTPQADATPMAAQTRADALRLSLPDVPPLPEFAAPR